MHCRVKRVITEGTSVVPRRFAQCAARGQLVTSIDHLERRIGCWAQQRSCRHCGGPVSSARALARRGPVHDDPVVGDVPTFDCY